MFALQPSDGSLGAGCRSAVAFEAAARQPDSQPVGQLYHPTEQTLVVRGELV
jgi:hypothetical protein